MNIKSKDILTNLRKMAEQMTLKQMIGMLITTEIPKSNNYVRQNNSGRIIQNLFEITEDDKNYIALIVSHGDLEDLTFSDDMIYEMKQYTEIDDDCPMTLFSYYSEKFIWNSSVQEIIELCRTN